MTISIPDFSRASVVVVGDVMLDRYLFGGTSRISPEAPVPVVHVRQNEDRAGGAANVAVNLARLGVRTTLLGVVGQDDEAGALETALRGSNVDCNFTSIPGWPTITKTRVQSRGQQLIRLDREEIVPDVQDALTRELDRYLQGANAVVLSDYGKGSLNDVTAMIDACRSAGVPVFVDPKGRNFEKYRGATLLTPNQNEFEAVAGTCTTDDELVEHARKMLDDLDLSALLITRSEKGMLLIDENEEPEFLSTRALEVYDVTGAGDTVIAVLAAALASGESLKSAAQLSNLAAGLVVGKIGVASITPSDLRVALHRRGQGGRGLVSEDELLPLVVEARERKERIIMTNGCFDVLHAGHVAYLEEAKGMGDRLIVAINDDDSVRRLKGDPRPVNELHDRMAVLAGLASVDWVVPFSEDTPERVIGAVLPDVLVKGGDYRPEEIAGSKQVLRNGGEVRVLAFRDGQSSSRIIDKLRG
ncbi:MAG: bifunctional D-glycero-beta-D-manno-heptose-7-phosphate kinase/D-glycero-beta-D-manno-heptose 1-phosphate adenylyltransferase HldE [Proteobacteria bacterium]|nr:bifunctional D-glycero-beta-D-manno-heptose-7-phosphate kinase/D-glycero-beta-D-manno-heptose 1-phosphate adenylyltransferase HldE [Pseudomonadota bacterium]MDA0994645.1 bifunctional D-glycero-beta-D-manno-heptose-7-phosphate kinase/D-glycero-beta-D-manno-heptose 1-phosphate adenylyltransferase HldE [Pseudomonadota bacterium]